MAKKKTYYDPQNGQQYYHGEKLGASNWGAPETDKDETYLNQYNYTPSYDAYLRHMEELRRREEEERLRQQQRYANPYEEPNIKANTQDKYALKQAVKEGYIDQLLHPNDPTYSSDFKKWEEDKMKAMSTPQPTDASIPKVKPMPEPVALSGDQKDLLDTIANNRDNARKEKQQDSIDFQNLSNQEKYEMYINELENTALKNGTLPTGQRVQVSEYKYQQLNDAERKAIDTLMKIEGQEFDDYTNGGAGIDYAGRGNYNKQKIAARDKELADRENAKKSAINVLKAQGWDDAKIKREVARFNELEDFRKTSEKYQRYAINPNDSTAEKWGKGILNTAEAIPSVFHRGIESLFAENGAYGRNTSSRYAYSANAAQEAVRQVSENAIGNDHPIWQKVYEAGEAGAESLALMLTTGAIAKGLQVAGAGTALTQATKAGEAVTGGMKAAAATEKAIELASLVPFSANAYDSGYKDAIERGYGEGQAQAYAMSVGAVEAATEIFSLDRAWKMAEGTKLGRNLFASAAIQAGIEGSEEMASELGQRFADYLCVEVGKTGKTQKQIDIEEYMAQNPNATYQEAAEAAAWKFAGEVALAGASGVMSSGITSPVMIGIGVHNSRGGRQLTNAVSQRYSSLDVKGDSEYEQMLKADKEKYQNNPTQFIVDQYKAEDEEGERIKAGLQDIADKEKAGKKLSVSDKAYIAEHAQVGQEFIEKLYDMGEDSAVPYEYRDVKKDISEDDARIMLAEAAKAGDTDAYISAMQAVRNSSNEEVAKNAERIIHDFAGMAMDHGITKEDMGKAVVLEKQAYMKGMSGEDIDKSTLTNRAQIAYNEGRQRFLEKKAKTVVSSQGAINSAVVATNDGTKVKLAGRFNEKGEIVTSDGKSKKMEDLDFSADSAVMKAYKYANNYRNINAKNEFLRGIKEDTDIKAYAQAFKKDYDLGMAGVSEEEMLKGASLLDKDQRKIAYEVGKREAQIKAVNQMNKAWGVVHKAEGIFYNDANIGDKKAVEMFDRIAAQLGVNVRVVKNTDGFRGSFDPKTNTIVVNAAKAIAVFHEIGEFAEVYNKEGYDELKKAVADMSVKKFGTDRYYSMLRDYEIAYGRYSRKLVEEAKEQGIEREGLDTEADEMSGEMFNDIISAMLSTDKGAQAFADYLAGNYGAKKAKSLGQQAVDMVKRLASAIKKMAAPEKGNLSGTYQEAVYQIADELAEHADKFIEMLDKAVQNYQSRAAEGNINNIEGLDETQFSFSLTIRDKENYREFSKEISNYVAHPEENTRSDLKVMDYTPKLYQKMGLNDSVIYMTKSHFNSAIAEKVTPKDHNHGIYISQMKYVPFALEHPAMVLNSINPKTKDSIVIVSDIMDFKGDPIICAIRPNDNGTIEAVTMSANKLASVYGRKNFKAFLENTYNLNGIMYVSKKQSQSLFGNSRVQFPFGPLNKISFDSILHTVDDFVNNPRNIKRFSLTVDSAGRELSEGQKEYFKDSKIVDKQGRLKVMYHGTPNKFTVFDPKKLGGKNGTAEGYGIYFSDTQEVTKAYGNEQLKGYLNVTHPATSFEKTIKPKDLTRLVETTARIEAAQMVADGEYDTIDDALKDTWVSNYVYTNDKSMGSVYKQVADNIIKMNAHDMDIIQDVMAGLAIRDYEQAYDFYETLTDTLGIDGFVTEWVASGSDETSSVVVAFNSNQFKNIDNENPTENSDIRFSIDIEDDRVYLAPRLRGNLEIVKNATDDEYRQMREDILKEMPWLRGTDTPLLRHTYDEEGNTYYWSAADGIHAQVEPLINKHWNTRTSQHWEWWTKEDKDDYPIDYSYRYSLTIDNIIDAIDDNLLDITIEDLEDDVEDLTPYEKSIINEGRKLMDEIKAVSDASANEKRPRARHLLRSMLGSEFNIANGKKIAFTDERVEKLLKMYASTNKDYGQGYLTYMSPADYLLLTTNGNDGTRSLERIKNESTPLDIEELKSVYDTQPIFLDLAEKGVGRATKNEIIGHEGRHRMYALQLAGFDQIPVLVLNYDNKYSKQPISELSVYPQRFNEDVKYNKSNMITLTNLQPLTRGNEDNIRQMFGSGQQADLHFSIDIDSEGNNLTEDQREYFKDSQIRDDNGNLKVMYHGSNAGGFTVFNPKKADDKISLFFTDNMDVADSYVNHYLGESVKSMAKYKSDIPKITDIDTAVAFLEENGYTNFFKNDGGKYPRWSFNDPSLQGRRVYEWSQKDVIAEANSLRGGRKGLYKVYLDIQNPLIVDGGNKIDGTVEDVIVAKQKGDMGHIIAFTYNTPTGSETVKIPKTTLDSYIEDTFEKDAEKVKTVIDDLIANGSYYEGKHLKNVYVNTVVPSNWNNIRFNGGRANTRYIAGYAHENGYDGVYFKNITDNGGVSGNYEGASNVAVAFHSDQVKAVDNMHPTTDPDIRYSIDIDSQGRQLSEGQQRYFNNSKVVDENGALKVMYHGARHAGFLTFNANMSDDGRSFFFTDSLDVAKSYSGTHEIFNPDRPMSFEELSKHIEDYTSGDMYLQQDGDDVVLYELGMIGDPDTEVYRGSLKGAQNEFMNYANNNTLNGDANYEVYLNLQNPYVFDAKGANWDELNEDIAWSRHFGDVQINKTDAGYEVEWMDEDFEWKHDVFKTLEDLEKMFGKIYEPLEYGEAFISDIYLDKEGNRIPTNTRMISQMAQEQGHDGVIFKNVFDLGLYASSSEHKPSTVVIAYNSNQIKSVYNIAPTSSEDIRYALDLDEGDEWVSFDPILDSVMSGNTSTKATEEKAIDILEKGMEALKNKEVDLPKLRNLALKIRNEYGSSYNTNTLTENLRKAFAYMQTEDHVDYPTMMGILRDIARPVIEQSGEKVGEEEYKQFINYFKGTKVKLSEKQKEEVRYRYGSYGAYRNAMMPIIISDNGSVTLDQLWDEAVEQSGFMLDRDAAEGDMPLNLLDTLQSMRPTVRNDFGGDIEDVSKDLAMRIVEEYIEGEAAKQMHEEVKEYRARLKKDYQDKLKDLKGQVNAEARARLKRRSEEAKERQAVRDLKHSIKMSANKLYTWITKPTEGKSVPHNMVVPVMQFMQAIDFVDPVITNREDGKWQTKVFDRVDYENGRKRFIYKDIVGDTYEDVLRQFREAIGRGEGTRDQRTWADKMQGIREIYDKVLKDSDFEDNSMDFLMQSLDAQGLAEDFDDLLSRNKGEANMNHLNSKDLTLINNILNNIFHAVNQGNKAFSANVDIINLAQSTMQDADGKEIKNRNRLMEGIYKMLRLDNVTPRTFFKLLGNRGIEVYKFLRGGLNQEIEDLKKASEFMEEAMKGIDASKWTGNKAVIHEFALSSGSVKMTDGQILGLYFTIRRKGGMERIKGGIEADDIRTSKERIKRQNAIHLTDADIRQIESVLTPEQIALGKKMQKYMADDCSRQGNDTSLKLYGFKKFTDDTYYPWTADKDTVPTNNTSGNIPMFTGIERSGFTKQLKEGASNPLVIRDIFDVFTDHVAQMSAYHGYAASVKDTLRWMNYREKSSGDGFDTWSTTKKAINRLAGSENGVGYITNLLLDINKANQSKYIGNFTDRLMGNYKAAAVGANLRVVAQQPTAYLRALNVIDPKYLLTVNPSTAIKNIKKSQEYSPISWWKSKGYYETNLGQPIKEIVTGISTTSEKIKDVMMSPAGWADDFTWGFLYTAVEKEQRDKLRGQDLTPEQFRKAVNERFDEVIDNTQVVDSTLHRSQYMRSTDRLNKIQTAFMAEPTKSYNMLLEAAIEDMDEGKTMKRTARAIGSFLLSALATSAAAAVVDAMRKSRDDEDWWEVWLNNLKENIADNMNPFNLLPVVKDVSAAIYNQITGTSTYGQSGNRFDIEAISSVMNAVNAWKKLIDGENNKTGYGFIMANLKPFSQITGIPMYGLARDVVALYNTFFENIETTINSQSAGKNQIKKDFVKDVNKERSEETLDESITDALNHGVSINDLKGAVQNEYKNKYFDLYSEGDEQGAKELADRAARAYARMGLSDEEIDDIINGWQEEAVNYNALDKAIANGEGIVEEVKHVRESKDDDKIIKHIMDRFTETVAFEDTHDTESTWRQNVETALQAVDPTLTFDTAHEEALENKKAAEETAATTEKNQAMKQDFFDAVEKKDGSAGRKALETMKAEGIEGSTVKKAVSSRYHEIWKGAKTQAEKDKAKSDWKSAYTLVNNVYGTTSNNLDKTWADWEADQK